MVEDSAFEDNQVIGSAKEDMTLVAFANGAWHNPITILKTLKQNESA